MTDRAIDRALTEAGYMPTSEYVRKWGKQMNDEKLEEIRARAEAATPGPWAVDGEPSNRIVWCSPEDRVCFMTSDGGGVENGNFIAHARTDIPALLHTIAELRKEVAREWRPIETAPKDGTEVLLLAADGLQVTGHNDLNLWAAIYPRDQWWYSTPECAVPFDMPPTHWMPLPNPPPRS